MTITENFELFLYFNFEINFLKNANLFQKAEVPLFTSKAVLLRFTKIENEIFSYKTALSEANDKTNRMWNTKRTYHKERSFASYYFIFSKTLFQFKTLL